MTEKMIETEMRVAPVIKAYPDNVTAAFDDFMGAFESFKEVNDRRLGEIERKLTADVLTTEKLDRVNRAIDDHKKKLDELVLKKARPELSGFGGGGEDAEHKAAFDRFLRSGDESGLRAMEGKAFATTGMTDGMVLAPPQVERDIGRRMAMISPMRRLASVREVSSTVLKRPFSIAGITTGWAGDTTTRPQTNTQSIVEITYPTAELYAQPAASQTLLDDAVLDMESWIAGEVETVFAEQESSAFIAGDGVNKPRGILVNNTIVDTNWVWGMLGFLLTGVNGALKATSPSDTLFDLVYALKSGYRQNGTFMMNRRTQAEIRKLKDSTGNYIWMPPTGLGQPASLLGFPIAEAEDMPDMSANGFAIAFGDFKSGYLIVDRRGVRVLRDPYSAKPYVLFYVTKRVGGGVQNFEAIKLLKFATS